MITGKRKVKLASEDISEEREENAAAGGWSGGRGRTARGSFAAI
jgi:hypothetical protein